jgi:phage tail tape-measure protein
LLFLLGIVGVALGVEGTTMSTMLTSVTGVIGTLVGAFFGIRLGSEGKERVEEERAASDALAKSAMGQLEPDQLETVVRKAEDLYGISGPGNPGFE